MNKTIRDYRLADPLYRGSKIMQLPPKTEAAANKKPEVTPWKTSLFILLPLAPAWQRA